MHTRRFQFLGMVLVCTACGLVVWNLWPQSERSWRLWPVPEPRPLVAAVPKEKLVDRPAATPVKASFTTPYTLERLSEEYERGPSLEDWTELSRILLEAPDGDLVESVKACYAVHAGTKELAVLADAFDDPVNDDTRQRVLDVFGSLQSTASMEAARQILTNESLPLEDHLVNACAVSLARKGEQADVEAIFKRLNGAGEDPEPEGSLYSNADGLMGAISILQNPALEQFLMDAAAGFGAASTGRARLAAAAALQNYHTVPAMEVLSEVAEEDENPLVRKQAAASLKSIQTPE